jgi:hypothetical protein
MDLNTASVRHTVYSYCCIQPSPGRERIIDVVPGMDGVRTLLNKTGSCAGSTHLQIIPTSTVWSSNFIQTLIAFLRGSADSNQIQHKATTVASITIHMVRAIHLARPYPNKEKMTELSSFHARSAYWGIKSINKYCVFQKACDRHNSAYHNPAEKKEKKVYQQHSNNIHPLYNNTFSVQYYGGQDSEIIESPYCCDIS